MTLSDVLALVVAICTVITTLIAIAVAFVALVRFIQGQGESTRKAKDRELQALYTRLDLLEHEKEGAP